MANYLNQKDYHWNEKDAVLNTVKVRMTFHVIQIITRKQTL